jgi:hypothetical protein
VQDRRRRPRFRSTTYRTPEVYRLIVPQWMGQDIQIVYESIESQKELDILFEVSMNIKPKMLHFLQSAWWGNLSTCLGGKYVHYWFSYFIHVPHITGSPFNMPSLILMRVWCKQRIPLAQSNSTTSPIAIYAVCKRGTGISNLR